MEVAEERSSAAYEHWRDASQRFDYFLMGATGALCAFIAHSFVPHKLSFSPNTAELVALLLLAGSVAAGFRRAQHAIHTFALAHKKLYIAECRGQLVANLSGSPLLNRLSGDVLSPEQAMALVELLGKQIPMVEEAADEAAEAAGRWAAVRDWLLAIGFLLLLTARVWSAYV